MDEAPPKRRKMSSYTIVALLGLFVVAALVAMARRLLPRGSRRPRDGGPGGENPATR